MNKHQNWNNVEFSDAQVRGALSGKSFDETVDSVRRALNAALPTCQHARPVGKQNRHRAALLELEWRAPSRIRFSNCEMTGAGLRVEGGGT